MISTIILISLTILVDGKKIKYYSNFKFEKILYGQEDMVVDYLTLADACDICRLFYLLRKMNSPGIRCIY